VTDNYTLYAIIVSYNGRPIIGKAINSIIESSIPCKIIVVDNASEDGTFEYLQQTFQDITLIKSNKNLGFGKGNNLGIRKAIDEGADHIFLLNQDAWVEKNTLEHLVKVQVDNKEYGIVSPIHMNEDGTKLGWYFSQKINAIDCPGFINDIFFKQLKKIYPIEFIHASGWMVSKECIQKVGVFDPVFPHYGEDNDFAMRVKYHQFKIGICTTAKFYHIGKYAENENKSTDKELYFTYIQNLVKLKNLNYTLFFLFYELTFNVLYTCMTLVLTRQFKKLKLHILPYFKIIKQIGSIRESRKISKQAGSFI
jgi:GT2 family glycosyltransferase